MARNLGQLRRLAIAIFSAMCLMLLYKAQDYSSYTLREDNRYLQQAAACFDQISSAPEHADTAADVDCRAFLRYIRDTTGRNSAGSQASSLSESAVMNDGAATEPLDCYSNLDVFSNRSHPFRNRTDMRVNYIESFRRCGKDPKLLSHSVVPRLDDLTLPVPNVVHFIWSREIGRQPRAINFLQYMAVWSANKYIKPRYIFWHGADEPFGPWWNRTVAEVPNIYYVHWQMPKGTLEKTFHLVQFQTDLLRLWILIVHGGMYFDTDLVILKSFEPLRQYPLVEGRELRYTVANGVIVAAPWSLFLRMCLDAFRFFKNTYFTKASMMVPNKLSRIFPNYVHVENRDILYPTWPHVKKMYTETFDWSTNYCIHIFGEVKFKEFLPKSIHDMDVGNTTLAAILRHVYYGDARLRLE